MSRLRGSPASEFVCIDFSLSSREGPIPLSTSRLRLLLAAGAATAAALAGVAAPAVAITAPATTTSPAAAAAGWLAQQVRDATEKPSANGDHFDYPGSAPYFYYSGLTADAIYGLATSKTGLDKITAALAYIESHVVGDANLGQPQGSPGPYDGSVAKAALAALVAGADPTSFAGTDLLGSLAASTCTAVSAPDPNNYSDKTPNCPAVGAARNIYSSVSESLVITALSRGAKEISAKYAPSAPAVTYFLSLQCTDGGFTGNTTACGSGAPGIDETAYAIFALQALDALQAPGGYDAELARAVDWLQRQQQPGGYWETQGGPSTDSTGLAAAAIEATGGAAAVSRARAWLATQQVTTGPTVGINASRGALKYQGAFDADASIKATADGLLGLARGGSLATLTAQGATAGTAVLAPVSTAKAGRVPQGGRQTVTGVGFAAGENVAAVLHSIPVALGSVTATNRGTATVTFTVPAGLDPGTHSVVLTGASSGLTTTVPFTVTAAPTASAAPTGTGSTRAVAPASTGTDALAHSGLDGRAALDLVLLGLTLIAAGGGVVYAGRRRA